MSTSAVETEVEVLCKVKGCREPVLSTRPIHLGMCPRHYERRADGRPRCRSCRRFAVPPYVERQCEFCANEYQETTPFESHVLQQIRDGKSPLVAVQTSMGPETTRAQASRKLNRMSKNPGVLRRMRRAMGNLGITEEELLAQLRKNTQAKKAVFNKSGDLIAEVDDVRGSNQALDLFFKLMGAYPGKRRPNEKPQQHLQAAVVVLPPEQIPAADETVYRLPQKDNAIAEDDE